jgi:hypothetical protein
MIAAALVLLAAAWPREAGAGEDKVALGEVSVPAPMPGADRATLVSAAEGEIHKLDATGVKRRVVVSVAIVDASDAPVALSVDACLRDGKSGAMLAILKGRAAIERNGDPLPKGTINRHVRSAVLRAAVRNAIEQIPTALAGS